MARNTVTTLDVKEAAQKFHDYAEVITQRGDLITAAHIQYLQLPTVQYLYRVYMQGREGDPYTPKGGDGHDGAHDFYQNEDIVTAHAPLYYLCGQIVTMAGIADFVHPPEGQRPQKPKISKDLWDFLAGLNQEVWKPTRLAIDAAHRRVHGLRPRKRYAAPFLPEQIQP